MHFLPSLHWHGKSAICTCHGVHFYRFARFVRRQAAAMAASARTTSPPPPPTPSPSPPSSTSSSSLATKNTVRQCAKEDGKVSSNAPLATLPVHKSSDVMVHFWQYKLQSLSTQAPYYFPLERESARGLYCRTCPLAVRSNVAAACTAVAVCSSV